MSSFFPSNPGANGGGSNQPSQSNVGGDVPPNPFVAGETSSAIPGMDVTAARKGISMQTVLLVLVVAISAGALYAMRHLGMGKSTANAAPTVEYSFDSAKTARDHRPLLAELNATRSKKQVDNDLLKRNPFEMPSHLKRVDEQDALANARGAALERQMMMDSKLSEKQEKILAEARQLRVNGVMGGSDPIARINGQVYRVGDTVGQSFVVKEIYGRTVVLEAGNQTFSLEMD
jgi:hypothetical protein